MIKMDWTLLLCLCSREDLYRSSSSLKKLLAGDRCMPIIQSHQTNTYSLILFQPGQINYQNQAVKRTLSPLNIPSMNESPSIMVVFKYLHSQLELKPPHTLSICNSILNSISSPTMNFSLKQYPSQSVLSSSKLTIFQLY